MTTEEDPLEIFKKKEDLHHDLIPYIVDDGTLTCLKHPFVYCIFYTPTMNAFLNRQYLAKVEYIKKAYDEQDWHKYIILHERPYRFNALQSIHKKIKDDKEYWKLVSSVWIDSENLWEVKHLLKRFLLSKRSNKEYLMDEEEREFLDKLPNSVKVYRGHQSKNKRAYSWTLSYWKAKWFSTRFKAIDATVSTAICKKEDIIAVLMGRGEFEIIANPSTLTILPFKKAPRATWIKKIEKQLLEDFALSDQSHHGPWHWEKVELNAVKLAEMTGGDPIVAQLFALIHDSCRIHESEDPEHGKRAGALAEKFFRLNMLKIDAMQLKKLINACEYHEYGETSNDPTIGACWDADRLDLMRVGIVPDEKLLSTNAGKELIWRI